MRALGLMSGTSLDGIDAVLLDLRPRGDAYTFEVLGFKSIPFDPEFRTWLLDKVLPPSRPAPAILARLDRELGRRLAEAALAVAGDEPVDFVASHGLTVFHDGAERRTLQLGDPYLIREALGATVVFDFRRADCAAGGQGAPLVPYVDAMLLRSDLRDTLALNLGGIANLTVIRQGAPASEVRAWDVGPGNILLDAFVRARTRGKQTYDADGVHALSGRVSQAAVEKMLADPYFAMEPPKSTGRERFGTHFLKKHAASLAKLSLANGCATLAAFTVEAIARDIERYAPPRARMIVSGGGVHNHSLLAGIALRVGSGYDVVPFEDLGVDGDAKEAMAFALLGYEALRGRPAGVPAVTGANCATVLGAIAPRALGELLAKMEEELAEA
jgi:anhydro-N-acetylmuramic acid kinase